MKKIISCFFFRFSRVRWRICALYWRSHIYTRRICRQRERESMKSARTQNHRVHIYSDACHNECPGQLFVLIPSGGNIRPFWIFNFQRSSKPSASSRWTLPCGRIYMYIYTQNVHTHTQTVASVRKESVAFYYYFFFQLYVSSTFFEGGYRYIGKKKKILLLNHKKKWQQAFCISALSHRVRESDYVVKHKMIVEQTNQLCFFFFFRL